jgi:5,10-methylenetetrahydrofolate reductase
MLVYILQKKYIHLLIYTERKVDEAANFVFVQLIE